MTREEEVQTEAKAAQVPLSISAKSRGGALSAAGKSGAAGQQSKHHCPLLGGIIPLPLRPRWAAGQGHGAADMPLL